MAYEPTLDQLNQDRPSQYYTPTLDQLNQDRPIPTPSYMSLLSGINPSIPAPNLSGNNVQNAATWIKQNPKDVGLAAGIGAGALTGGLADAIAAPAILGAGEGLEGALGSGLLSRLIPKALTSVGRGIVSGAAGGGAGNAVSQALQPNTNLSDILNSAQQGAVTGAKWGAFLNPAIDTGIAGISSIPNLSSLLNKTANSLGGIGKYGNITPEEVEQNMKNIPEGIKIPLGNLINSPKLQRIQGILGAIPFSGAEKTSDQLNSFLNESLDNLKSNIPSNVDNANDYVFNEYKNRYEDAKEDTSNKFDQLSNSADNISKNNPNINFDDSSFKSSIKNALDEISPQLINKTSIKAYKPITDFLNDFNNTPINDFQTATNVGKSLNNIYRQYMDPSDGLMRRYINQAKSGLEQSIDDNAANYPELSDLRNQANSARKYQAQFENLPNGQLSPFYKIYNNPRVTDTGKFINSYLQPSKGLIDNSALTNSLTSKLSPETNNFIFSKYISPTGDETIGQQLSNIEKLNDSQLTSLIGDKKPLVDQLKTIKQIVPESTSPGFVPKTGYTGNKQLSLLAMIMHPYLGLGPLAARMGTSALKSNTLRDLYLNSLKNTSNIQNNFSSLTPYLNLLKSPTYSAISMNAQKNQENN